MNQFYSNLSNEDKNKYKILFNNSRINNYNEILKDFIELQKDNDEIDMSFVYFPDDYDFTNKNSSLNKIFEEKGLLQYYTNDKSKTCSKIIKEINFAKTVFCKKIEFIRVTFEKQINFEGAIFNDNVNFQEAIFEKNTNENEKLQGSIFEGVIFNKEAIFQETKFKDKAKFFRTRFEKYTSFEKAEFFDEVDFENCIAKDLFYFHNVKLGKLNLIGSHLDKANFLRLHNNQKSNIPLTKNNIANKDTARILKSHFENENNILEANIYFVLEQEFYLDLLKRENSKYPQRYINLITVYVNKYISNFGTDWVRVLIVLFGFGFLASFGYSLFDNPVDVKDLKSIYTISFNINDSFILFLEFYYTLILYLAYHHKGTEFVIYWIILYLIAFSMFETIRIVNNSVVTLINPLNIFNQDMAYQDCGNILKNINYFEKIALYGVIVKGIAIALIYQFIISFRNSTRRK